MDRRRAAGALLALAACIACSAAAPTTSNHTALDLYEGAKDGCYYNFQHYGEGDRIMTNEPCLNCTCHNRMLMCYLRVCPFTKPIGQDCTVEKRADQCCPIVTCPDVPVDLLTSTSTTSPAEYGATGLGKQDKYGCSINGRYLPEGSKVPPTPNKPCEHCYCIRNMTTCVMQECTLHVDGCTPIYHKDVCCPVRYSCDHPEDEVPLLDDMSTTVRPTPGFLLTTTTLSPVTQMSQDCVHNDEIISDGASIRTEKACEHCYCMKGDIVCVVQECGAPMENEGKNCTSLPPREGQCCPDTYICEGDEPNADVATESVTDTLVEKLTTSPPRRTGVEGSGYRNEDELAHTQMPTIESELEGSGEEQDTAQITQEPVISGKPLDSEEITHTLEEGDQYIPVTPKASESVSQVTESSSDSVENETAEPQITMITTPHLTEEDLEKVTDATKIETEKPYVQEAVSPGVPESLEHGTIEPSEYLNTVPDILPEQAHDKPHEYIPTTMGTSIEETNTHVQKESEPSVSTSSYNEQGNTPGSVSQEPSVSDYTTESLDSGVDIEDATTKKSYDVSESVTQINTPESEKHVDAKVTISDLEEIRTVAPQTDTNSETPSEEDSASSIEHASTIPTIEKVEKETTEPDQASTFGVVEEKTPISNVDSAEKTSTTPFELHIDVTSPVSIAKEQEQITGEPDKGLNTIPNEIDEETTQASLLETRNTEPTISVDATERIETDTKLATVSDSSTSLLETHVTKGDQYTITTEPSFRREDEASVSTEKPKEALEITTVKTELVDEGLIPTSMHDKEPETGTNIPSVDEYITTGIPDYIDTDKELDDTVASVKPVTESVPTTTFGLNTVTEKVIGTTLTQENGLLSSTEKTMDVTVLTADDNHYEPSRIPGEGDCLLNAVTYRNNTVVPSTNKCHISCKCVSSIIKCDPVICSPLPENMHNCQSIYDNPDSCCPTYICDSKETHPPKSDSQMSGTELPVPPPVIECRGDQCELSTKEPPKHIEPCTSDSCIPEVIQDSKAQDAQQTPCSEENGCKSQETVPSDCTGDKPCRRKDTDKDQTLPPKCEGSHCVQQISDKATETSISDKIPTETVPTEQEPSQPTADSQITKHGDTTTIPQIITENAYESTEHTLFATTEREIISDKITEKIDVDIATEEFIPARTEGTKKPDLFEQDGIAKPTIDQTVATKDEDVKKPTAGVIEDGTYKPEIYVDEHTNKITPSKETVTNIPDTEGYTDEPIITETQDAGKPYERPEKPIIVKEEDTNILHDAVDKNNVKPSLTDAEGTLIPIVTEEHKITDDAIEEQTDKSTLIDEKDTNVPDTTDKDYNDKHSYTDSQDTNISEHINEIDSTQSVLIEQEVTKTPEDVSQNLDTKIPQFEKVTSETPTYIEKDITNAPNTEKDVKIPDLIVIDKTDRPTSFEDSFTKLPEIRDDKYTESIPITDDSSTIKSDAIDEIITDVSPTVDEHTIKINVLDEQSSKPDDFLVEDKGTDTPQLVKDDKIIPIEKVSTQLPSDDVEHYTDKTDITGQENTPLPDDSIGKQTESPFTTPKISESATEKDITTGDEDKNKPASVDKVQTDAPIVTTVESSEKTESDKEEGITQSAISEESTGLPEMVENIVTIKPLLIDESTDLSVDIEDTKVTKTTAVTEEITTDKSIVTDNKMTDKSSATEDGTKIPDVLYKDEDNELIDKEPPRETPMPETQASTQASITTELELPTLISDTDSSSFKEEKQTGKPAYVTQASATEATQSELYVTSINEELPDLEVQAVSKDTIPPEDTSKLTLGPVITQTSSVSPISEQEIKPVEPEIYTPEKEEMITSSIDSVTEPFKGTEIDDIFATEPEETVTKSQEKSTERIEPLVTDKEIPDLENVSELSISDGKTTKAPEESYTKDYQGYGETTVVTKTEPSNMSQNPEISTSLPVFAEPTLQTSEIDSENKIKDSSEPTFTDLPLPAVTLAKEKPSMPLDGADSQNEKATKMPDLSMESDLSKPTSPTEMYVTGVQTPTGKPESHVTELVEEQANVEQSAQKPKLPQTVPSEDVDHPDISGVGESTTEKDDTKQTSPESLTDRPYVDLEVTKAIEEINIFSEPTSIHAGISESTPYLVELEEHTHKIAEDIDDISTSDKGYTYQATEITTSPRLEEESINSVEDSSTISPATEKYDGEKVSYTEIMAEKEISTTEKTSQPHNIDTDRITVSVNEVIESSTTEIPEKTTTSDSEEKYDEPSVKPTSEKAPVEPSLSEDKESKPEDGTDTEQTHLPKDEDHKPDEERLSGGEEIIPQIIIDHDGEPGRKPIIETTDIIPVSDDKSGQTEKETLLSTTEEKDKKPDEPVTGTGGILSPVSVDKNVRPDELPSSESESKPGDKSTSEIEETTPSVDDKYTKLEDVIISKETTIPSTSTDSYDKPEEQPSSESGEIITPLSEDKTDKPDVTIVSQTEVTIPSSLKDKDDTFVSKPQSSESEETTPSITEDKFIKPDEQSSGETGDIELPHSEQKDDMDKPSSGPGESVPSVSQDKYAKPDVTHSSEAQTTILPGDPDKDRKPDGQPIDEIESSTPTSSGEQYDMSDRPSSEIDDNVKPLPSKEKDEKPDEKPITDTEETDIPSTEDKYDRPDITDSSETEVTSLPISVDIVSKPVEEGEKTTPSIPEDKYSLSNDKFTTETGDILTSLPEDKEPEKIMPPSTEEKYDKPDLLPGSEAETGVPLLSEDVYGKPTGKPSSDSMDTTLPISTDKYDKVDEKPSIELDKIVPPTSEDKESKPHGKPISGTEEIIPTVSDDEDSKPENKPTSETEDVTPISKEKDREPVDKPISPLEDIVPTISDDKLPNKEAISGTEEIAPTVQNDKDGQLEKETTIPTGNGVAPITEDKSTQPEQQSTSSSEEITPEDKDSKPTTEPEQIVPTGSEENETKTEDRPISGIKEIMPSVSKDKIHSQPEEEPVSEIVPPAIEDKDSKPDEKPVSGSEEIMPSVAEEDDSKIHDKPISKPGETMLPGAEDQKNKADEKPTSGIEETVPPVVKDKDSKPDEESITQTVETMAPTSEDKYGKPNEAPISQSGDSIPTTYEDGEDKLDKKPISEPGDIQPPVTQDKDSKPQDKPISELEETERPITGDKDSKPDEKPIINQSIQPVRPSSEHEESKPDEKPLGEIEGILPSVTKDKERIPEEESTSETGETMPSTPVDKDSKPNEEPLSESDDNIQTTTKDKDSKPEGKPITEPEETVQQVTEDKDIKPEEKPITGFEETISPVTKDKDSQPEEKPISGIEEIVPSDSGDKFIKPDDTLSSETETPMSEDKDEKPVSGTIVVPVADDKFARPDSETGATIPPTPEDKYSKPDEIPTSQTTESTPSVASESYGKPDGESSEGTLPTSATPEIPKPLPEAHPTDELPVPEEEGHFPPSGTGYGEPDYVEEDQAFGPGTCRYGGKVYVSAQQIPRDDPCDFCFCFRSDIICLQQSCPPPIHGCHEEPIQGFCCPRYECPVSMATTVNVTTTTTTTTTTLPPHFPTHSYKGAAQRRGCQIKGHTYKVGDVVRSSSGPCLHCTCGGDGQMKCDPKACTPEPMLRQMIAAAVSAKRRR